MRILLSLTIIALSLSAGTAYAYLSPGEVFPELNIEEGTQAPVQAIPVLDDMAKITPEMATPVGFMYLIAAIMAVICACVLFRKKAPKIANSDVIPPMGEV